MLHDLHHVFGIGKTHRITTGDETFELDKMAGHS